MTQENTAFANADAANNTAQPKLFRDGNRDTTLSKIATNLIAMGKDVKTTVRVCNLLNANHFSPPLIPADVERKVLEITKLANAKTARVKSSLHIKSQRPVAPVKPIMAVTLEQLSALLTELAVHRDYPRIQPEFIRLSMLLNEQRLLAPAFRPRPKVGLPKGHLTFMAIHHDQIIIDCHWLHCRNEAVVPRDEHMQPLFDLSKPFSLDLAREFAEQGWTRKHRIEQLLVLTPRQQCQLATLRGKTIDGRFEAALKGIGKGHARIQPKITAVRLELYEWAERNKGVRRLLKDYESLWLARELLGNAAPIRQIAELFALISGRPKLDDKTVRGKLETLEKHIGGTK